MVGKSCKYPLHIVQPTESLQKPACFLAPSLESVKRNNKVVVLIDYSYRLELS